MIKKIINKLYVFVSYYYNIYKRKNEDYFNYEKLSEPFEIFYMHTCIGNKFYGINRAVKSKLHKRLLLYNTIIEHGIYFSNELSSELTVFSSPVVYTMGRQREEFLKNNGINAHSLGPFILYSDSFKSDKDLKLLKEKLGKTLLVFPTHSIEGVNAVYDELSFVYEIQKYSNRFDTVLICMYWKDVIDKRYTIYEEKGFKIVTAGHRSDPFFLSRLKDLITISDMTMSNNLGTHVGYSLALKKPHYIFSQECSYEGELVDSEFQGIDMNLYSERKTLFFKIFGKFQEYITKEQLYWTQYYWGNFDIS